MKLNHIYNVLKENKKNLFLASVQVGHSSQDTHQLTDIQTMLQSFKAIELLDIFESIEAFKSKYHVLYSWGNNIYSSTYNNVVAIQADLKAIKSEVDTIATILENFIPKEEGYVISIKLPEYESLSDLPKFYKDLDIMLTPLINYFSDDTLTIHSFENGSKWNDFLVKNKETITVILLILTSGAALYASITDIQRNKLEIQRTYQSMQGPCTSQELPEELNKIFEKQIEDKYDEYTNKFIQVLEEEEIEINTRGSADEEIRTVIKRSFKSYQVLISEGTQFYGQLDSEDTDINELVEKLDTSQKVLMNLRDFQLSSEGNVKSLMESNDEEKKDNPDTQDED